ncbi:MAG: hypothetical protein LBE38_08305 [Deltaproteobacteria bacterium]|jgi:hypothetical protein|nr:hypothetical protein [Deltaproteobacteria bacterium]
MPATRPARDSSFKKVLITFALSLAFILPSSLVEADPPPPHEAKPQSTWSLAHLYDIVSKEPPLNENDIDFYIKELPQILALQGDPRQIPKVIAATGWSENRLAYVVTKMGTGLISLLEPQALASYRFPFFSYPSPAEAELIKAKEKEIQAAFTKIIDAETPRPERRPKKK